MKLYLQKLAAGESLTREEARDAMREIMEGAATEVQIAAFLMGLKINGESVEELAGFVDVMREKCVKAVIDDPDAIDMCGTGGDNSGTFNISTAASFVVAGGGVTVAKHGNRSVSSRCGSADVLRALGVNVEISPELASEAVNRVGIGFLFAPHFHPAMKHAAKPRAEMGIKTAFNMLGPMTNPAGIRRQVIGTFSRRAAELISRVMLLYAPISVLVLHSADGLDEISLAASTTVWPVHSAEELVPYDVDHSSFGLPTADIGALRGTLPEENASIILKILRNEPGDGANVVIANAALGFVAAGRARTLPLGVAMAQESIASGAALQKLNALREFTNQ